MTGLVHPLINCFRHNGYSLTGKTAFLAVQMPFKMLSIFDFPFFGLAFFKQALTNPNKTEHAVQSYAAGKTNKIAMLNKQCKC